MKKKSVNYGKWGYIFILPFFVIYFIFSLIPLFDTVRYSFFEYFRSGIKQIGEIRTEYTDPLGDRICSADRYCTGACLLVY